MNKYDILFLYVMFVCKYCGKEFPTHQKLGGHISCCSKNPNYENRIKNISEARKKYADSRIYKFVCEVCGNEYELKLSKNDYSKGKYRKTCSRKCAHIKSVENRNYEEINSKISEAVKNSEKFKSATHNRIKGEEFVVCPICGKVYSRIKTKRRYCSEECMLIGRHKKLSENAKKQNFGGLNPDSFYKFKMGWYKGIFCNSSFELAYLIYCLDHNIPIKRCNKKFVYSFKGKQYNYYPDFIINEDTIVEVKGYINEKAKAKHEQYPEILLISNSIIDNIIKEVIYNYGKDFTRLFENHK